MTDSGITARKRVVYWVAAAIFAIFGLLGPLPFLFICLVPAALCLVQAHYQRTYLWLIILGLFLVGSAYYGYVLLSDVLAISGGRQPRVLLDMDDSFAFIIFVGLVVGVTCWLLFSRPQISQSGSDV